MKININENLFKKKHIGNLLRIEGKGGFPVPYDAWYCND